MNYKLLFFLILNIIFVNIFPTKQYATLIEDPTTGIRYLVYPTNYNPKTLTIIVHDFRMDDGRRKPSTTPNFSNPNDQESIYAGYNQYATLKENPTTGIRYPVYPTNYDPKTLTIIVHDFRIDDGRRKPSTTPNFRTDLNEELQSPTPYTTEQIIAIIKGLQS